MNKDFVQRPTLRPQSFMNIYPTLGCQELWRQSSHGWANFGFYGAKARAMDGPTLGSMAPKQPWMGQLWVLWHQRSHGWANFGFYGAKGAMAGPTLGSMVPKEPWMGQLWVLWRQSRLMLTHVLGRLNHFISLYRPITNFA